MNIYIIIKDGVTCKTCYTSLKTIVEMIKGPHLQTIYKNFRKHDIYSKNGLTIERLLLEKLPNRNNKPTFTKRKKLSTAYVNSNTQRFSSNTAEFDEFRDTGIDE